MQDFKKATSPTIALARCFRKNIWASSQYNVCNREPPFVPGGSVMRILVPWKPVVLVWGLLSGMILVSFVASSLLQGKDPFAPPSATKTGATQTAQQASHSHKAARTPNQ